MELKEIINNCKNSLMCCRAASNISDEGDENSDDNNDDGKSQAQEHEHKEIKHRESSVSIPQSSQSSSNNRIHTPPPICVTPGKWYRNMKYNRVEEKMLHIIEKLKPKHDEDQMFCLGLAVTLKKITDPQRKELIKLQLQQSL